MQVPESADPIRILVIGVVHFRESVEPVLRRSCDKGAAATFLCLDAPKANFFVAGSTADTGFIAPVIDTPCYSGLSLQLRGQNLKLPYAELNNGAR